MVKDVGTIVVILLLVIPVVAFARRFRIAYPIALVVSGLALSFVPGLPKVELDPSLVLLTFLPPLLYWQAITAPTEIMRANAGQISTLAFGLVAATTVVVASVAHVIIPELPWAAAFVLGAVVSSTDELAATPVLHSLRLPRHVIAIVEGESLFNDATALAVYAAALAVLAGGNFRFSQTLLQFVLSSMTAIGIGLVAGRFTIELWRRFTDVELQGVISLVGPFLAYVPAQYAGVSGVLAVVATGMYANRHTPRLITPVARLQIIGFWKTLAFAANAVLFLIVGLQFHAVASAAFERDPWQAVVGYGFAVTAAVVAVRLTFVLLAEYVPVAAPPDHAAPNWRHAMVVAWSGLRGSVSLAAALAIPFTLPGGERFPHRETIVFITFVVIIVTLVGGGLSLASLVRGLGIRAGREELDDIARAHARSSEAALARITELQSAGRIDAAHASAMRRTFEHRSELHRLDDEKTASQHLRVDADAEQEVIAAQRAAIIEMRERGEIDNVVLRELQAELDLQASRRESPAQVP